MLAYIRSGSLYVRDVPEGKEREVYHSGLFDNGASSFLWDSDRQILLNIRKGSEAFGTQRTVCKLLDLRTGKIEDYWTAGYACAASKTE